MNYYTKANLISAIEKSTTLIELKSSEESSVMISEYGGRPLGIFPKDDCFNLLWIVDDIKKSISTRSHSIGGDRYWISPERYFFYQDPENWKGWFCPPGLDPANYQILADTDKSCTLFSNIRITDMHKKREYRGEITRQFTIVDEPIQTRFNYCGIEILDDCVIYATGLNLNGWSLATVITGGPKNPGTVLIPTNPQPEPLSYFREIPKTRINVAKDHVAYKIDADNVYKLAIRPEDINFERKAKIGYVLNLPGSDEWGFLVKLSDDIPRTQDNCFDISRDHPDLEIGVIQSYNSESPNKPNLNFGEIELQLNKFKSIDNTSHGKAKHQLLAYICSKEEILDLVEKYLGITSPEFF